MKQRRSSMRSAAARAARAESPVLVPHAAERESGTSRAGPGSHPLDRGTQPGHRIRLAEDSGGHARAAPPPDDARAGVRAAAVGSVSTGPNVGRSERPTAGRLRRAPSRSRPFSRTGRQSLASSDDADRTVPKIRDADPQSRGSRKRPSSRSPIRTPKKRRSGACCRGVRPRP